MNVKIKSFNVTGKGDSLWCDSPESKRTFLVTKATVRNLADTDEPYELQLFGPATVWSHYTDSGIKEGVNAIMLPIIQALYPSYKIKKITWSEQGMQPDDGWSFDIISESIG